MKHTGIAGYASPEVIRFKALEPELGQADHPPGAEIGHVIPGTDTGTCGTLYTLIQIRSAQFLDSLGNLEKWGYSFHLFLSPFLLAFARMPRAYSTILL